MVLEALESMLAGVDLDEAGELQAEIARALATQLDAARESSSGTVAMAVPAIAKELRAVVSDICDAASDDAGFVTNLFSAVEHSANSGARDPRGGGDPDRGGVGHAADAVAAARARRRAGGRS